MWVPQQVENSPGRWMGRPILYLLFFIAILAGCDDSSSGPNAEPAPASVSPSSGVQSGGTDITITGSGFTSGSTVTIGGLALLNVNISSSTTITGTTPASATTGAVDVVITSSGGTLTISDGFTYYNENPPTVSSISPEHGPETGGTTVTIQGTNFDSTTTVTIGGQPLQNLSIPNATQITGTTPSGLLGAKNIVVTTPAGSTTLSSGFTFHAPPELATSNAISPNGGNITGSTSVTITGSNFVDGETTVTIGSQNLANLTVTSTTITGTTLPESIGDYDVVVTTPGGSITRTDGFSYHSIPSVTSIVPNEGTINGGETVVIVGTNFTGITAVTIGGIALDNITVVSTTQITGETPPFTSGTKDVVVTNPASSGTLFNGFTYYDPPTITSISPTAGTVNGGDSITLNGTNFSASDTTVTVDGVSATNVSFISSSQITFDTPAGSTGSKDIVVTTPGGSVTSSSVFTYYIPPTLVSVSPTGGTVDGTTSITINGTNFVSGDTTVTIGGSQVNSLVVVNSAEITCTPRSSSAGAKDVVVTTPAGTATLSNGYTYYNNPIVSSISPSLGDTDGGLTVTVQGSNFVSGETTVTIGGSSATEVSVSSTGELTCKTPVSASTGSVDVVVTTPAGTATLSGGFEYLNEPTVSSISPSGGKLSGGDSVTITGTNFVSGETTVTVGGTTLGSVSVTSSTIITGITPAGTVGAKNIVVTTPGGSATLSAGFVYYNKPTITSITPDEDVVAGGATITINGSQFVPGSTTVTIGGNAATVDAVTGSSQITLTAPAGTHGPQTVVVETPGGNAVSVDGFTYFGVPTISAIDPNNGATTPASGYTITVTGTNFIAGNTDVTIDGVIIIDGTVVNSTTITGELPSGTEGTKDVVVTTPGGTATLTDGFTYISAPSLSSVSPDFGPEAGGSTITLTGSNFVADNTSVTIGGEALTNISVSSSSQLTGTLPANTLGTKDVTVTTPAGTATLTGAFEYLESPTITNISPNEGPTTPSSYEITITGTNFESGSTAVRVGGTLVSTSNVTVDSSTQLRFDLPSSSSGSGAVDVSVEKNVTGGSLIFTESGGFTYLDAPTITSVSPDSGPTSPTSVTVQIQGSNFINGGTTVTIGGSTVTNLNFVSTSIVEGDLPSGTAGGADVVVTTNGGTATLTNGFTYLNPPVFSNISPSSSSTAGTSDVVISGSNFVVGDTTVEIFDPNTSSTISASNVSVLGSSFIQFDAPGNAAGVMDIIITTPGGTITESGVFTYGDPPTLTNISPTEGSTGGGGTITLTGTNFVDGYTELTFNGSSITGFTVVSSTQITFTLPSSAGTGTVDVTVTNPNVSSATLNDQFTYFGDPTITSIHLDNGPATGGTKVTIVGTNFSSSTTVTIDGVSIDNLSIESTTLITGTTPTNQSHGAKDIVVSSLGTPATSTGGYTYTSWEDVTSLDIRSVITANNFRLYGASPRRGVLRAIDDDGDGGWTVQSNTGLSGFGAQALAVDPTDLTGDIVYVGTKSGGVFRSTDGGDNWSEINDGFPATKPEIRVLVVLSNGQTAYAGTASEGVYKTDDITDTTNNNWTQINSGLSGSEIQSIDVNSTNESILYVGTRTGGVSRSTDGGSNWSTINGNGTSTLDNLDVRALAIVTATSGGVDTILAGTNGHGVYQTSDGGASWSAVNGTGLSSSLHVQSLLVLNSTTFYVGLYRQGVYRTTDGGTNWSQTLGTSGFENYHSLTTKQNTAFEDVVLVGNDLGIYHAFDSTFNFSEVTSSLKILDVLSVVIHPTIPDTMFIGTEGSGVFRSTDGGETWEQVNTGLTTPINVYTLVIDTGVIPFNLYAGTDDRVWVSSDSGDNWSLAGTGLASNTQVNQLFVVATNILYGATGSGLYLYDGSNWSEFSPDNSTNILSVHVFNSSSPYTLISGAFIPSGSTAAAVERSTDSGTTYLDTADGLPTDDTDTRQIRSFAVGISVPNKVFVATARFGIYRTDDISDIAGNSFQAKNTGLTTTNIYQIIVDSTTSGSSLTLYTSTEGGVFKSTDNGENWTNISSGITETGQTSKTVAIHPTDNQILFAAGAGTRGLFKTTTGGE